MLEFLHYSIKLYTRISLAKCNNFLRQNWVLLDVNHTRNFIFLFQIFFQIIGNIKKKKLYCLSRGNFQVLSCDLYLTKKFGITLPQWLNITKIINVYFVIYSRSFIFISMFVSFISPSLSELHKCLQTISIKVSLANKKMIPWGSIRNLMGGRWEEESTFKQGSQHP